jgi:hypothetical protein
MAWTLAVIPATVNPSGAGARASTAASAARIRAGLVHVDAADPAGAQSRGQRQLVQRAAGDEAGIDAVQRGAKPLAHAGQPGHDFGEAVKGPAAAELPGVVGDRLEPQDARAFGVALECQQPEVDFEHRQVPRRCLERDPDPRRGGCAVLAGCSRARWRRPVLTLTWLADAAAGSPASIGRHLSWVVRASERAGDPGRSDPPAMVSSDVGIEEEDNGRQDRSDI